MNRNILKIFMIILFTALIAGGGVYWWQNQRIVKLEGQLEEELEVKNILSAEYTDPYPMSWFGASGAEISLTGITYQRDSNKLVLICKVNTGWGSFCTESSLGTLRLTKQNGDLVSSESALDECTDAHSTLLDQEVMFLVSPLQKEFVIKGKTWIGDLGGDKRDWRFTDIQDLFKIIVTDEGVIQILPLIG